MDARFSVLCCALLGVGWATGTESNRVPADLKSKITKVLESSPALTRGRVGFSFVDVDSGRVLAQDSASHFFTPASNAKLYTTALALTRLGADYRVRTQLRTRSSFRPGLDIVGDLQIIGGGDPNLSGRTVPYQVDAAEGDPIAAVEQLADAVVSLGIRCIDGDVTGVASRYGGSNYPDGWTLDDSMYGYGAPVSSLSLNDSLVSVVLRPAERGELAEVELRPSFAHFVVQNQLITDDSVAAHVKLFRAPGTNQLVFSGTIGRAVEQWREDVAVDDPALFAAEALVTLLRERGVQVSGQARAQYGPDSASVEGVLVAERLSRPLSELLQVVNKESQNLHAEMLLREVAYVRTGVGSLENGQREREAFLTEAGITHAGTGYVLDDGSGLARQDLATPESTVALLRWMWMRPDREIWLKTLPIGGVDGSLQHRFRKVAGGERIRGKTGSLSHVNTLSGYIETREHRCIAFSVMVNGTPGHESEVRDAIDRLCAVFLTL